MISLMIDLTFSIVIGVDGACLVAARDDVGMLSLSLGVESVD